MGKPQNLTPFLVLTTAEVNLTPFLEEFFTPWESAFGYTEWQNPSKVMPDNFFSVPPGPQLPYPETAIPPPPSPHP